MMRWDPNTRRWLLTVPRFTRNEIVATITPPNLFDAPVLSLADPRLALTIDDLLNAVTAGEYMRKEVGTSKRWMPFPNRRFLVHQVLYRKYLLYVIWGYPREIERYLDIKIRISASRRQCFQAFILGWNFYHNPDRSRADRVPIVTVMSGH